ncbi:TIGR02281 family clan AA aspartic protease [Salinarimonas rosea]|uniref:TIGR02281 family clan AA aspartic protease n=1 Tax=Salinarimonas rosea TaxID=552063 RepID=UPI00041A03B9|nr:TIGR02281 family clan AA aspartic protease [Salinarimonas rosea]
MPESLAAVLGPDADLGTAALATVAGLGAVMALMALAGGSILAAVVKRIALLLVAAGVSLGGFLMLRDGESAAIIGDLAARLAPSLAETRTAPAPEPPRVGLGPREVVAYMERGAFALPGRANGAPMDFLFDTGATAVVLTAENAARIGWPANRLAYTVRVSTANGTTTAAPITLERVAIGGIEVRDVRAFVAQPGDLRENLLGMSFLAKLASYEVRGDRLLLRGW